MPTGKFRRASTMIALDESSWQTDTRMEISPELFQSYCFCEYFTIFAGVFFLPIIQSLGLIRGFLFGRSSDFSDGT